MDRPTSRIVHMAPCRPARMVKSQLIVHPKVMAMPLIFKKEIGGRASNFAWDGWFRNWKPLRPLSRPISEAIFRPAARDFRAIFRRAPAAIAADIGGDFLGPRPGTSVRFFGGPGRYRGRYRRRFLGPPAPDFRAILRTPFHGLPGILGGFSCPTSRRFFLSSGC